MAAAAVRSTRVWPALARAWWRANRSRSVPALVVVGLAAGAVAGVVVAAADGARRTATVLDRVADAGREPDVLVIPGDIGFDWEPVLRLPEITAAARFAGPVCAVDLTPHPEYGPLCGMAALDRNVGVDIARGVYDEGRGPALDRADEIEVSRAAAEQYGVRVGDTFAVAQPTVEQLRHAVETGDLAAVADFGGPRRTVRVTGVGTPTLTDRLVGSDEGPEAASLIATPAFGALGPIGDGYALVRLAPGTDVGEFRRHLAEASGRPVPVRDLADDRYRLDRSLLVEEWALAAFAGVLLVAGAVLVGQPLGRLVRTAAADVDTLVVLGATPREAAAVVVAPFAVTVVVAVATTVGVAAAASTRLPIGTAREIERSLGVHLDGLVLGLGLVVTAGAIGARVVLAARSAVGEGHPGGPWRPSVAHPRTARPRPLDRPTARLPVPVGLGASLALGPRRTRRGDGPARTPILAGAVVGVLGVVGAWTFRDGLDRLVADPALAGTTWDHVVDLPPFGPLPAVADVPGVAAAAEADRTLVELGGQTVSVWSYRPEAGAIPRVLLEGRLPVDADEATVGWGTARTLDVGVGDSLATPDGVTFRVVGIGLLPEEPGHSAYDQGLWVTPAGWDRLGPAPVVNRKLLLDLEATDGAAARPDGAGSDGAGRDATSAAAAIQARLGESFGVPVEVREPDPPAASRNLETVRPLPLALGAFLAVLAVGVSTHAVTTTIRRRRHDFAVLRALGATRRQVRLVVASQATTIALVGILLGVPLGLATGRAGWRWMAHSVPFVDASPVAVVATILVGPAALAAVNLGAALPARRAGRVGLAETLRTE
jgi:hypothetical protein